jgi:hypothetical protein
MLAIMAIIPVKVFIWDVRAELGGLNCWAKYGKVL